MARRQSRFRNYLNRNFRFADASLDEQSQSEADAIRRFVRQSMNAQFATLSPETGWTERRGSAILHWQFEGAEATASLAFHIEEQPDGSQDLLLENWPKELEPLVLISGEINTTEFAPESSVFLIGKSIFPHTLGTDGAAAHHQFKLAAADGDASDDDAPNWQALNWNENGLLRAQLMLPHVDEPFVAIAEMEYKIESTSGNKKRVRRAFLMKERSASGLWFGTVHLERPDVTGDGRVKLTVRPPVDSDLHLMTSCWSENRPSIVSDFLAKQTYQTHAILDHGDPETASGRKRIKGVESATKKGTSLRMLAVPAGGPISPLGKTFRKAEVEGELKALSVSWDDARFADLWVRIYPRLTALLIKSGFDRSLIEDHLQEAAVLLLRSQLRRKKDDDKDDNLVGFVIKTVMNAAMSYYRVKKNTLIRGVGTADDGATDFTAQLPDDTGTSQQLGLTCDFYHQFIAHLSDEERTVWICAHEEDRSVLEIADRLGRTFEQVRNIHARIKAKLRVLMGLQFLRDDQRDSKFPSAAATEDVLSHKGATDESSQIISQLEYDVVFLETIKDWERSEAARFLNLDPKEYATLHKKVMSRVVGAIAAQMIARAGWITDEEMDLIEEWLFREASLDKLCVEFSVTSDALLSKLHRLGCQLHGQILILTDTRRGPLFKVGCEYVEKRVIQGQSLEVTNQYLRDHNSYKPRNGKPPKVTVDDAPNYVYRVWQENETLVPRGFCQLNLPELAGVADLV